MSEIKQMIYTTQIETPIGIMIAGAIEEGICLLEFSNRRSIETQFKSLIKYIPAEISEENSSHFIQLQIQLKEYFDGKRKVFSMPLVTPGTAFQQLVWKELLKIPFGSTRSYKQQAIILNKLPAIRAVANANGLNRIAIIIPCHRIIGENGSLTGYGGGLWRKKWLLDFEKGQKSMEI